jgi:CRISPR-associated exonuclease Cas4
MEHTSELVDIGKIIHESSYSRKRKEIELEGIKVDLLDARHGIIHEVKKSKSLEDAHFWQLKYYLFYFKQVGIEVDGIIDYPKLRRREMIRVDDKDISKIQTMLDDIKSVVSLKNLPPVINKSYCKKCSYYEFCYC